MNGKLRHILLLLLAVLILGAVIYALYILRGFGDLPLIGKETEKPVVVETPPITDPVEAPTPEPTETPAPTAEPTPAVTEAPAPAGEDVISSLSGTLQTAAGELRYRTEIVTPEQGEEADGASLGHVYVKRGLLRVQLTQADGSAFQEPFVLEYASENLHQESRVADLNGDGSEELVLRLHTFEDERAVLLFAWDEETGRYVRVGFQEGDAITWSTDYDAASNELWYRHGTVTLYYDCYELQGSTLVLTRRLADEPQNGADERFTEYAVDGSRILTLQEKVGADKIDRAKWSFINFA